MRVYVIMGNDYPAAVCASEEAAEKLIALKVAEPEEQEHRKQWRAPRIHWRWYEFEVQD